MAVWFIQVLHFSEKLIDFLHLQINHFMNILKYLTILNNLLLQLTKEIISWFGVNIRSITFWIFFREDIPGNQIYMYYISKIPNNSHNFKTILLEITNLTMITHPHSLWLSYFCYVLGLEGEQHKAPACKELTV